MPTTCASRVNPHRIAVLTSWTVRRLLVATIFIVTGALAPLAFVVPVPRNIARTDRSGTHSVLSFGG